MNFPRTLFLLLVSALTGCTFVYDIAQWTEDAYQPDGRTLTVSRQAKRWGWGVPGVTPGDVIGYQVSFKDLGFKWKSDKGNVNEPIAFEIIDGYPVLVLFDEGGKHCAGKALDDYAAQILILTNKGWGEISQDSAPLDRMHKNLFDSYWRHTSLNEQPAHMSLEYKHSQEPGTDYLSLSEWFTMPGRTCKYFL